jgi:tetratricopeptide (TPR) repeat protein
VSLEQAAGPLEKAENWADWVRTMIFWGLCVGLRGDPAGGLALVQQGLKRALALGNLNLIGSSHLLLSLIYMGAHDAPHLFEESQIVLEFAQKSGDQLHRYWAYGFAAFANSWQRQLDKAAAYLEQAVSTGQAIGPRLVLQDWFAISAAEIAFYQGKRDEALTLSENAVQSAKEIGSAYTEGIAHRIWGQALCAGQAPRLDEAEAQLMTAAQLLEIADGRLELARCHQAMGCLYRDLGNSSNAELYFANAAAQFAASGLKDELDQVK